MGIYKFGNNTYPRCIRNRSTLGHIFWGKKCVLWAGKYGNTFKPLLFLKFILYGCSSNTGAGLVVRKPFQKSVQCTTHIKHITKQDVKFNGKYTRKAWIGITITAFNINEYEIIYAGKYQPLMTCGSMKNVVLQIFTIKYTFSKALHFHKPR
jgi:hypothetical protein